MAETDATEALQVAIRELLLSKKEDLAEAGPKAVLAALQESGRWADVSAPKCKRVLKTVRDDIAEREKAALARRGTKYDCPKGHGLARFRTPHASFCCDVCRVYVSQGAGMWGCRECDWDVCEMRCRPKELQGLADLQATLDSLNKRVEASLALEDAEKRLTLALLESEVHQLEKSIDGSDLAVLISNAVYPMTEETARAHRKTLLQGTEALCERIEKQFKALKEADPKASMNGQESSSFS